MVTNSKEVDYDFEADLTKHSYYFVVPSYGGMLHVETVGGLMATIQRLTAAGIKCSYQLVRGGTIIDMARNALVREFLDSTHDTMIFLDSDIAFDWAGMQRLLAWNTAYPVVSGAYNYRSDPPHFNVSVAGPLNHHGLLPVKSLGIGFTAIKRSVFEALDKLDLEKYKDEGKDITAYFRMPIVNGRYTGEDVFFFHKCIEAGIQPMVDPWIELGHVGAKVYNTPFRLALNTALKQLDG